MHLSDVIFEKYIEYNVPKDKEKQLYDFYLIASLESLIYTSTNPKISSHVYSRLTQDDIDTIVDAQRKLTDTLSVELLDGVYFAICSEIMTMFSPIDEGAFSFDRFFNTNVDIEFHDFVKYLGRVVAKFEIDTPGPKSDSIVKKAIRKNYFKAEAEAVRKQKFETKRVSRLFAVELALRKFGKSKLWFIMFARELFKLPLWAPYYGGDAWTYICEEWLRLKRSNTMNEKLVGIDRLYQAQHNTNTVFNKLVTYYKEDTEWRWIIIALDLKFKTSTPAAFFKKASPALKKIGIKIIANYNRVTGQKMAISYKEKIPKRVAEYTHEFMRKILQRVQQEVDVLNKYPSHNSRPYSITWTEKTTATTIQYDIVLVNGGHNSYTFSYTFKLDMEKKMVNVNAGYKNRDRYFTSVDDEDVEGIIFYQLDYLRGEIMFNLDDIKI